jgi:hypothetical protein
MRLIVSVSYYFAPFVFFRSPPASISVFVRPLHWFIGVVHKVSVHLCHHYLAVLPFLMFLPVVGRDLSIYFSFSSKRDRLRRQGSCASPLYMYTTFLLYTTWAQPPAGLCCRSISTICVSLQLSYSPLPSVPLRFRGIDLTELLELSGAGVVKKDFVLFSSSAFQSAVA